MSSTPERQVMLLTVVDSMTAELARQNLEDAGIPAVIEMVRETEFGDARGNWDRAGPVNLFVPESALERAREALRTAGSPADLEPLVKSGALGSQAIESPSEARGWARSSSFAWLLIAVFVVVLLFELIRRVR